MASGRLTSIRRHRDKFLAHNLTPPAGPSPRFGYERKLLRASQRIALGFMTVLEDSALDVEGARDLCRRHASEFWDGLSWELPPRSS